MHCEPCLGWLLLSAREVLLALCSPEPYFFLSSRVCRPTSCHQGCLDLQRLGGERGQPYPPPVPLPLPPPFSPYPELLREAHLYPPQDFAPVSSKNRYGNKSWRRWDSLFAPLGLPNLILLLRRVLGVV